jgi:hypothetical protein
MVAVRSRRATSDLVFVGHRWRTAVSLPTYVRSDKSRAPSTASAREGIKIIRTPVRAPNANAHMERWVGSRPPARMPRPAALIVGRGELEHVVRVYNVTTTAGDLTAPLTSDRPARAPAHPSKRSRRRSSSGEPPRRTLRPHPRVRARRGMMMEFLQRVRGRPDKAPLPRRRHDQPKLVRPAPQEAAEEGANPTGGATPAAAATADRRGRPRTSSTAAMAEIRRSAGSSCTLPSGTPPATAPTAHW